MSVVLKGVAVQEPTPPEGLTNVNGEWFYDEYAHSNGVSALGLEDRMPAASSPAAAPVEDERKSILDLFRR